MCLVLVEIGSSLQADVRQRMNGSACSTTKRDTQQIELYSGCNHVTIEFVNINIITIIFIQTWCVTVKTSWQLHFCGERRTGSPIPNPVPSLVYYLLLVFSLRLSCGSPLVSWPLTPLASVKRPYKNLVLNTDNSGNTHSTIANVRDIYYHWTQIEIMYPNPPVQDLPGRVTLIHVRPL